MKPVLEARDVAEAQLVKGLLDSLGLTAVVRGDDPWGTRDDAGYTGGAPTVLVLDDADESAASEVVAAYQDTGELPSSPGWNWRCRYCGQESEPQFGACWSCGAERSGDS